MRPPRPGTASGLTKIRPSGDVHEIGPQVVPNGNPRQSTGFGGGLGSEGADGSVGVIAQSAHTVGPDGSTMAGSTNVVGGSKAGGGGAEATTVGGTSGGVSELVVAGDADVVVVDGAGAASSEPAVHPASAMALTTVSNRAAAGRFGISLHDSLGSAGRVRDPNSAV